MGKKIVRSTLAAIGFTVLFLVLYLATHDQVIAPTTSEESTGQAQGESPNFSPNEEAFKNALNLYIQKKQEGIDMSSGPCLGMVAENWVLDIAHSPRQPVDDKVENQCEDFVTGKAEHFIEFDPNGQLIRSK